MRTAGVRWTAAAIALAAGLLSGYVTGRPVPPAARTAHAGARSSRLGRTAPPTSPGPAPTPGLEDPLPQ